MLGKILRAVIIVGILAAGVGIAAWLFFSREAPPTRPAPSTALLVDTVPLQRVNADFTVQSQGTVLPKTETVLSSEVSGTIVDISPKFVAGGFFKAGEVLMRIDPTNYEVAVDQAKALVRQREIEFEGAEKLRTQGFRAEADYASASAALATARAELVRSRRNLERTYIRLPYDGLVRQKSADLGQFVNPGTKLGVTFSTGVAEVRLPLTDQDLAFVDAPKPAATSYQSPAVTLSAVQQGELRQWPARIVRSEGIVDLSSRVTYLVAQIDDPYGLDTGGPPLPIGSFVSAQISGTSRSDILRVPRSALRGSNQLMIRDDESRLRIREIDVIRADAEYAYIASGAEEGEQVIVTALESPVNGTPVRTPDEPPAAAGTGEALPGNGQ